MVAQVKAFVVGKKKESIEETRVKPTVIRRRKTRVSVKKTPAEPVEEAEAGEVAQQQQSLEKAEPSTEEAAPKVTEVKEVTEEAKELSPPPSAQKAEADLDPQAAEPVTPPVDLEISISIDALLHPPHSPSFPGA